MKAGVLLAQNDIRYMDWQEPELRPGCIKLRVRACGICGSDVPRVLGAEAHFYPVILGHEFSGDVVQTAADVSSICAGERVAGVPLLPCMTCDACQLGQYALCKAYGFIGSRNSGAFAEYVVIPAANAIPIDDNVSYTMGALLEPASVALHGFLHIGFRGGDDAVVLGTGNIGIFALQWARILGARRVAVCDILPERLALAKELGADAVFNTLDEDFHKQVEGYTNGKGFSYVFETAGQPATIKLGFSLARNRGALVLIGTPHNDFSFEWKQWELMNRKELHVTGTWMSYSAPFPGKEWTLSAQCLGSGGLRLYEGMLYDTMPLSKIADAFALFETPGKVTGKLMLSI